MSEIFTTAELTLIEAGEKDLVRLTRVAFQTALAERFKAVVSDALGRRIRAHEWQIVCDPAASCEFFILEEP